MGLAETTKLLRRPNVIVSGHVEDGLRLNHRAAEFCFNRMCAKVGV